MERLLWINPTTLTIEVKEEEKKKRQILFDLAKNGDGKAIETLKREYSLKGLVLNQKTIF